VANSGLVQLTPGRLQYLDLMCQAYEEQFGGPVAVDAWNMHLYILPKAGMDGVPNGIANVALGTDLPWPREAQAHIGRTAPWMTFTVMPNMTVMPYSISKCGPCANGCVTMANRTNL
jgi:hypothetical protein